MHIESGWRLTRAVGRAGTSALAVCPDRGRPRQRSHSKTISAEGPGRLKVGSEGREELSTYTGQMHPRSSENENRDGLFQDYAPFLTYESLSCLREVKSNVEHQEPHANSSLVGRPT